MKEQSLSVNYTKSEQALDRLNNMKTRGFIRNIEHAKAVYRRMMKEVTV